MPPESVFIRTFKSLYSDLFKLYPSAEILYQEQAVYNPPHPTIVHIHEEIQSSSRKETEPLTEQRETHNIANSLNAIRNISPAGVNKLSALKKSREEEKS